MSKQQYKHKIEFYFFYDSDALQYYIDYEIDAKTKEYIDKGFSERQAKYYNRYLENTKQRFINEELISLGLVGECYITLSCGHTERVFDSIGGIFLDNYKNYWEDSIVKEYIQEFIQNIKNEAKQEYNITIDDYDIVLKENIQP